MNHGIKSVQEFFFHHIQPSPIPYPNWVKVLWIFVVLSKLINTLCRKKPTLMSVSLPISQAKFFTSIFFFFSHFGGINSNSKKLKSDLICLSQLVDSNAICYKWLRDLPGALLLVVSPTNISWSTADAVARLALFVHILTVGHLSDNH